MEPIETLIGELNQLCTRYIAYMDEFKETDRIKEVFTAIKNQGYNVLVPVLEPDSPDSELLSEEGRHNLEKMAEIRKKKIDALNVQYFEGAADYRDIERQLREKVITDFFQSTINQYFILLKNTPNEVIFSDPQSRLCSIFK